MTTTTSTADLLAELNALRVTNNKKPYKSWKASRKILIEAIAHEKEQFLPAGEEPAPILDLEERTSKKAKRQQRGASRPKNMKREGKPSAASILKKLNLPLKQARAKMRAHDFPRTSTEKAIRDFFAAHPIKSRASA